MNRRDAVLTLKHFCSTVHSPEVGDDVMLSTAELCSFGFTPRKLFTPTPEDRIHSVEKLLGFTMPPVLFALFSQISNGIAGFCYQVLGVNEGCRCHLGDILNTYKVFCEDGVKGKAWQDGLLPFVSWGCNIFSCIDSRNPDGPLYLFEGDQLFRVEYTLDEMFVRMANKRFTLDERDEGKE